MYRREYLEDRVAMLLGGRAAEQVILGTMTAGAADDIERAVSLARRMVGEMGMSSLGPVHAGDDPACAARATLDRIERAARRLVKQQLRRACDIVDRAPRRDRSSGRPALAARHAGRARDSPRASRGPKPEHLKY